ncbi:MAG: ArnT family glycosyltransferase [Candidatus Methylomirabilia bacterium]
MASRWLILFFVCFVAFFWRLGEVAFLENEGMYATITQEMLSSGDWVTLRFDGIRYFEKPPLWFWLTALTVPVMGASEFAIRLWSAIPAFGLVILTYLLGRRLLSERAGLFAGLILASSFVLPLSARRASTDLLFSACLALALYGFVRTIQGTPGFLRGPFLFYLGVGLAVLAKGLIGLLLPFLIVALFALVAKPAAALRKLSLSVGIPLLVLLTVPWHLAASWQNEGFLRYYIMEHHILRFLGMRTVPHGDIPASTLGFLLVTIFWFFPWSVLLPAAVADLLPRLRRLIAETYASVETKLGLLVPVWIIVVFGFFAISAFKHEYYALPAFPALALLVGGLWAGARSGSPHASPSPLGGEGGERGRAEGGSRPQWATVGPWLAISFAGAIGYLVVLFRWQEAFTTEKVLIGLSGVNVSFRALLQQGIPLPERFGPGVFSLLALGGVFALIGFGVAGILVRLRRPQAAFGALAGMGLAIALLILPFFRLIEPHYSVKAVASAIQDAAGPGDLIVNEGRLERAGGLRFYTGREVYVVNGQEGSLKYGSGYPEARRLFLGSEEFLSLWNSTARVFLVTNYPVGRSVRRLLTPAALHEVGLYESRWLFSNRR